MSLRVAATTHVSEQAPTDSLRVRLDDDPTAACSRSGTLCMGMVATPVPNGTCSVVCTRPSAYVSAMIGNGVVAVGRAVTDDGWAGVFGMATLPHARARTPPVVCSLRCQIGSMHTKPTVCISRWSATTFRHSGCTSGRVSTKCAVTTTAAQDDLVICPWRTTVYDLGVLDALADLPA
jgi:hypothetical protein